MSARDEILARIAGALTDVPAAERPEDVGVPRAYRRSEEGDPVERFVERASEYRADVRRLAHAELADAVATVCGERGIERLGVPDDLPADWIPDGIEPVAADRLDARELDGLGAALTGCALAIAETGTIVLDAGSRQGPRALTLVPDHHICVIAEPQIVGSVPEAIHAIAETIRESRRPITLVSGPSATSDIELDRVEGVHGPRDLVVLVVSDGR
ncbi:lactate utilization protein C [Gaiella sp.]|jgi:L-lactate dehydrogenase complex protein LldG|uniref:LutC/YkgG family protein n=1 Tax=Gaiella sp. TaxID=2663207 RepID=UPI002E2F7E1D|nr:lactate utilization protein C [Gaiella sp.]HEX5582819.1 lactate utilization protein C [Gaiella sp.]